MSWKPVAGIPTLQAQVNKRWPNRDKASDGVKGDAAHAARTSDHNPDSRGYVHAMDIDEDNEAAIEKAMLNFLATGYRLYLSGQDEEFKELEGSLVGTFEDKNEAIRLQIEALDAANAGLEAEIAEVF